MITVPGVHIEPWGVGDLPLLRSCNLDPVMMQHVGGPESVEKVDERQSQYERPGSRQY